MNLRLAALPLILPGLLVASAVAVPTAQEARGTLAILRRDGLMLPFASFNRDTWKIAWPIRTRDIELPVNLESVPSRWWGFSKPESWRAYLVDGGKTTIEVVKPLLSMTFCSSLLWLSTNYQSAQQLPPVRVDPFPKDGLVVGGNVEVEPIESVPRTSPEWETLSKVLVDRFNRVEDETLRGVRGNTGWQHPLNRDARQRHSIRLESWYRSPSGEPGWTVSYVEAVRSYPPQPQDKGCGLETLVSGWVHHQNGELRKSSDLRGKITYCDRVGATYMMPLGRLQPREKIYWVFQMSGWESEWYDVAEVGREKARHVVEVLAGGRGGCN